MELILNATKDIDDIINESNKDIVHLAAHQGDTDVLKLLLDRGFSANTADKNGYTPLHYAASRGYDNIAELLLKSGANPNATSGGIESPLGVACQNGFAKVVALLLKYNADALFVCSSYNSVLHYAVSSDDEETIRLILKTIESKYEGGLKEYKVKDADGDTPLMWAAGIGANAAIRLLLEHGTDVDEKNLRGKTALLWAAENKNVNSVKILVDYGANVDCIRTLLQEWDLGSQLL